MPQVPRDRSVLWICLGFVVAGTGLLVVGRDDPEARIAGLLALLFFGGLGAVYWGLSRPSSQRSTARSAQISVDSAPASQRFVDADRRIGVVMLHGRGRMVVASIGCAVFVASGLLMMAGAPVASPRFAGGLAIGGLLSVVVFGTFAVVAVAGLVRTRYLALLPDGLLSRQAAGSAYVPWSAVTDVKLVVLEGSVLVGLRVGPGARVTGLLRLFGRLQRRWSRSDVVVPTPDALTTEGLVRVLSEIVRQPSLRPTLAEPGGVTMVLDLAVHPTTAEGR